MFDGFTLGLIGCAAFTAVVLLSSIEAEARWCREQRRRMECDRPALDDGDYLRTVGATADQEALWLAARRAMAESIGLPAEAIHPSDPLADIWRMQGPDLLDVVFRLERSLGIKISRQAINRLPYGREPGEFRDFAAAAVGELSAD